MEDCGSRSTGAGASLRALGALFLVLALAPASPVMATEVGSSRVFGLGIGVGSPTSVVGKAFIGRERAVDLGLSFARYGYGRCWDGGRNRWYGCGNDGRFGRLGLNADYLWQYNLINDRVTLDWHVGVGGRLWFFHDDVYGNDMALGARIPIGLDLMFLQPEFLEVFIELAPTFFVLPGTDLDIESMLGVRFFF